MASLPRVEPSLIPFGPELWIHEAWVRFLGAPLKTRMTVMRLPHEADEAPLWLHSPIGDVSALRPRLDELGVVRLWTRMVPHEAGSEGWLLGARARPEPSPGPST